MALTKEQYEKRKLLYRYKWPVLDIAKELGVSSGVIKAQTLEGELEEQEAVSISRARLLSYFGADENFLQSVSKTKLGAHHARKLRYKPFQTYVGDVGVYVCFARLIKDVYGAFLTKSPYLATVKPEGTICLRAIDTGADTVISTKKAMNNFVVIATDLNTLASPVVEVKYWVPALEDFVMDIEKYVNMVRDHLAQNGVK